MRNEDIFNYIENRFQPVGRGMKPSLAIFILIIGLLSCKDDPIVPILTPGLVSEVTLYDPGNNGNSSDIRLEFKVKDNLNVIEYRLMLIPSSVSSKFNEGIAATISGASYLSVIPEIFKDEYSFQRLPSSLLDVNGVQIRNTIEYVVAIFVIGADNNQLSQFFTPFTLRNRGIYSGSYLQGFEYICDDGAALSRRADGGLFVEFTGGGDVYTGILHCDPSVCGPGFVDSGTITFTVEGTTVTNYDRDWPDQPCINEDLCPENPCPLIEVGEGFVIDELVIEITWTSEDCNQLCEGTYNFVRQPDGRKN